MIQSIETELENAATNNGADVFGIADLKQIEVIEQDYQKYKGDWKSVIVVGVRLPLALVKNITVEEPGKIYSYEYAVMSELLDKIIFFLVGKIEKKGFGALPIPARGGFPPMGGSLLAMARAAGIGSFGKNQLITHKKFGSRLRFAALVTDMLLHNNFPKNEDICKNCTKCIDVCPGKAINDVPFAGSDIRKNGVDRDACWNHIKQFLEKPGYGKTICGMCIMACPYSNQV